MRFQFLRQHEGLSAVTILLYLALAGCGGNSNNGCFIESIRVSPGSATVDHTAAPPGNTVQFAAFADSVPQGCAIALSNLGNVIWSVSDPVNASIGSTPGPGFGVATCKAAAPGTVNVKAVLNQIDFAPIEATASLTCQ